MEEKIINRVVPKIDGDSAYFWEECNKGNLVIQFCEDCNKHIYYPRIVCPNCMSRNIKWVKSSGKGKIYTYTIARRPAGPSFSEKVPYVIALVELEEGVRILSNIINCDVDKVSCELPVEVVFEKVGNIHLPMFEISKN